MRGLPDVLEVAARAIQARLLEILASSHGTACTQIDPSVTWEFVAWLRSVTKLPVLVKVRIFIRTKLLQFCVRETT